ncbi:hypothetical protein K443DRAFT_8967 [Laccaria amethystina LaAM-08-1]|uniref:Uncharacterized protein n=1 Tax=Laccaria amethystina LaAM-08-1 TaxID=1095629 RepID=A0A0C9XRX8_9AGAR|nr:hypothetical protein K443DRAFT_8967 [Laccaria amethystina LaAM-08-1]
MSLTSSAPHSGPGEDSSLDGRGEPVTFDANGPRYVYYRLYTKYRSIMSINPIYADDPYISRTLPKLITPPFTASSVKKHLCKIEVVGMQDVKKRSMTMASLKGLPMAGHANSRYVYYRLYDEEGAVASKISFDSEDLSLGRINMLSVAPPQTVALLKFQVMMAEDLVGHNIQLFKDIDGEVPMNDNDPISHPQAYCYPGRVADEPITIICRTQECQTKVEETEMPAQVPSRNPVPPQNPVPPRSPAPPRDPVPPRRPSTPQNPVSPREPFPPRKPFPLREPFTPRDPD